MSKETIRLAVAARFKEWDGIANARKSYQNLSEPINRKDGIWAHLSIVHVMRKVTSIGDKPCTTRTGTVMIHVFTHVGAGTSFLNQKTDDLENWFSFYQKDNLWLGAAITTDAGEKNGYYQSIVYIPFTYSD